MTYNTFYERVCEFRDHFQNRELETYLLALLRLVNQDNARSPDAESLLKLLQDAFTADPEAFNPERSSSPENDLPSNENKD